MTFPEFQSLQSALFASLHCALPGTVLSFDSDTRTADIQPAPRRAPDGAGEPPSPPLLRQVPVFMPVPFEVNPGDACLVVFADWDSDAFLLSGSGADAAPASSRRHSLSDGFAFVGFRPLSTP